MTSFFHFVKKRAIYRLGIISLIAHAPLHVTDFPVVNVHVDELSSARNWQHKLCATFFASVNINYRLPIKVYYRICTLKHIRIEINHKYSHLPVLPISGSIVSMLTSSVLDHEFKPRLGQTKD
jgi:hypothetical protein